MQLFPRSHFLASLAQALAIRNLAFAALLALVGVCASAQDFPNRPVTLVVPYSASQIDSFARALAKGLSEEWKQPVVVDNRPGANEIIAADYVAKSRPNGYTVFLGTEAGFMLNPMLYKKLPYDPDQQLAAVSLVVRAPMFLVVPASMPVGNVKDFIEYAKKRSANPISYGSPGVGGLAHLPLVGMAKDQGISLLHVPYKGGGAIMQDLLAGHVEASLMGAGITEPQVKAGKIKALAVSSNTRLSALPDVPTFTESGVADIGAGYFLGLAVPAGTPKNIVDKIAADAKKVVSTEAFRNTMLEPFGFTLVASDPVEFTGYIKKVKPVLAQRVKDSGVQLDMQQ